MFSMFQILLLSCIISLLTFQQVTAKEGSKQRFDRILAKFGFKGLSPAEVVTAETDEDDDSINEIQDNFITQTDTVTKVKNGVFVIKIRRKHPIIKRKKVRIFSSDKLRKHEKMFLNHLNERIQNPVFQSRYPQRRPRIK